MTGCDHHHHHAPEQSGSASRLAVTLVLIALFFLAELIGGWWTGSLALLADAGHMFSDMAALGIALGAAWVSSRRGTSQHTFGFYRAEILAALANGSLLFLVAGAIFREAWERFHSPQDILAGPMLAIALGGLVVNLISLSVLHGGRNHDLNLRGAWLHVLGDTLGSIGVIAAALLVWGYGWTWADPAASVAVCLLILYSAWNLVSEAARILMEHAPSDIDVESVRSHLLAIPEVVDVHCLHIWTISSGLRSISAHLVVDMTMEPSEELARIRETLSRDFSLDHITLQIERADAPACERRENGACLITVRGGQAVCGH